MGNQCKAMSSFLQCVRHWLLPKNPIWGGNSSMKILEIYETSQTNKRDT